MSTPSKPTGNSVDYFIPSMYERSELEKYKARQDANPRIMTTGISPESIAHCLEKLNKHSYDIVVIFGGIDSKEAREFIVRLQERNIQVESAKSIDFFSDVSNRKLTVTWD